MLIDVNLKLCLTTDINNSFYFFSNKIVPYWKKLYKSVIEAKSVNSFKISTKTGKNLFF